MFKKLLFTFFLLILSLFSQAFVFADSVPVENIFSDINKDYKYYNELQYLYDKGMIFPDSDGKFNPNKLLNRDEFVGIMMEVSCTKCISPNTSYDLISKYSSTTNLFFDLNKNNKNFYCIAEAKDSGYVKGYDSGTKCEDGTGKDGEISFCPNNTIILEEAIAVILKASGILTNSEADKIRYEIASGNITERLSDDVGPFNIDGSVYSFYPDFQKALNYEIVEYDNFGNEKKYKLIEKINNKLNPKQAITKEKFLLISYIALKSNSCSQIKEFNLGLEMKIYDKSCNGNISSCKLSDLKGDEKIYDFYSNEGLFPGETISNETGYIWRFYNYNTGEEIKKYGKFIDNYDFQKDGKYRVYLRVISDKGNTAEVYNDITIGANNNFLVGEVNNIKVSIDANPISGNYPLVVDFKSIVSDRTQIKSYVWNYGDGNIGYGINSSHIYKEPGIYEVKLSVIDSGNNILTSIVIINVLDPNNKKLFLDTDGDGIIDSEDSEINTPKDKILYVCTYEDIQRNLYNCDDENMLGVYSSKKEELFLDTDGDGVADFEDNEINTPKDKILYICTYEDIQKKLYNCDDSSFGLYSSQKANELIGDTDGDGLNDLDDACPFLFGSLENKGCPIFEDICTSDDNCKEGYYCNSGICSPKPFAIGCEYSGGDLVYGNAVCNSCPCSNIVDFNSILRKCDIVFPAITSPDQTNIYSKGNYFQVK